MRDYHQWKTGVRVDGLFGPLGMIGTFIGFFTGMVYPAIYEKMGLLEDYDVLYNDTVRNNLFEVLILCSAVGALLNLIPFCFYDLTENKHKAYVGVLKIRAMFENYSMNALEDSELEEAMEIILEAKKFFGKEKITVDRKAPKEIRKKAKEDNLAVERAEIVMQELNKFSGEAGKARLAQAEKDYSKGILYFYKNAKEELKNARRLPKGTNNEKEIRSDAIRNARIKKESASLIRKYGAESIAVPDERIKEELINRDTSSFADSIRVKKELRRYLKSESVYLRAVKPFTDAANLIEQAKNYTHYEELEKKYYLLKYEVRL